MTNIHYGKNLVDDIKNALSLCAMTVTDDNVAQTYPKLTYGAFVIPSGEESKNPQTLMSVISEMSARGLSRRDRIAAVGGGVVGDITGLAAALYMRGIEWINVPTTLLAMADAGIGGKTAVDHAGVKNLIGAFHAPSSVIVSYDFIKTLSEREMLCGIGEIVKTCLLTKRAYGKLTDNIDGLAAFDRNAVYSLIEECIEIKNAVVTADPNESGLRKILNVGHTVGHALESADGFKLSHGEYVLKGMAAECAMCKDLIDGEYYNELITLFKRFTSPPRTSANAVTERAAKDKKNIGGRINIMLPVAAGEVLDVGMERADFSERYGSALKELKTAWSE
ncbi:MAG: 3-dehydroquinate synthase [Clostridiales bacterium]|nr:3-dehydroquinate synthase [Clostridiales bacterium]